ncbi:MAG: TolC family protein [bacterium]|jgi:outer membrane protein TolC
MKSLFIIIAMILPGLVSAGDSLTVNRVVTEVLAHNDRVAAARLMEKSAREKAASAGAWNDPMLMLGVQNLPTSLDFKEDMMTMKMLGLSQDIPYSGYKGLESKAAKAEAEAEGKTREELEREMVVAARMAYYNFYYQNEILKELLSQKEIAEQVVEAASAKLRSNQGTQEDMLAAQSDLWRIETEILSAKQLLDEARFDLNSLRGADINTEIGAIESPEFGTVPDSAETWLVQAEANYPPLRRLAYLSESYQFSAKAANRMRWPMLNLSGNYGFRADSEMEKRDNMIGVQATLSLPIFSRRQQGKMSESMKAMSESVDSEARQLRKDIEARLRSLLHRAQRLQESLRIYREMIIPTSEQALKSAFAGYAANRSSFQTLLNYASAIYRDKIVVHQVANELASTMAEAEKYFVAVGGER